MGTTICRSTCIVTVNGHKDSDLHRHGVHEHKDLDLHRHSAWAQRFRATPSLYMHKDSDQGHLRPAFQIQISWVKLPGFGHDSTHSILNGAPVDCGKPLFGKALDGSGALWRVLGGAGKAKTMKM